MVVGDSVPSDLVKGKEMLGLAWVMTMLRPVSIENGFRVSLAGIGHPTKLKHTHAQLKNIVVHWCCTSSIFTVYNS